MLESKRERERERELASGVQMLEGYELSFTEVLILEEYHVLQLLKESQLNAWYTLTVHA